MKVVLQNQAPIDALPYVDPYNEAMKRQVDDLVQAEMRRFVPPNYLAQLPAPPVANFQGLLLEHEFQRMAAGQQIQRLDISRYKVEPPPQSKRNDPDAWEQAIANAQAQLEHQYLRLTNLELLNNYGGNMWRMHNAQVEETQRNIAKILEQYKKEIEDTNRQRKIEQEAAGLKIKTLTNKWEELVYKNFEIENACIQLEQDVERLRAQVAAKNSTNP